MDKQIRRIEKGTRKTLKDLKKLEREDKARDPACEAGQKILKKNKKP